MASIFTFDPDPPRVSSPWSTPPATTPRISPEDAGHQFGGLKAPPPAYLADCGITKLEAEPQDGPTEYKLHLLLRPRRSFSSSSTGRHISGSYQSRSKASKSESISIPRPEPAITIPAPSIQSRQNRLQSLTTQLLWRLQQSCPFHSSSKANLVLPMLPETSLRSGTIPRLAKLLPGLEESRGALYEIGVSDDGAFVGLTKDELDESLVNLRSMAASLGCKVKILRTVIVGECEWFPAPTTSKGSLRKVGREALWVAEVIVVPNTHNIQNDNISNSPLANALLPSPPNQTVPAEAESPTEQLRISLTGSTTSGKSSLLGTLSTSTLDNGRGKSRLSLLKHRHEIATGVTSSVAPELIGYQEVCSGSGRSGQFSIVNYGCGNVSAWNDIHNAAEGGRLVFLTDLAGHPRYRRTTVRGLVSWAPHWTLCCVASDDCEDASGQVGATASAQDVLGAAGIGVDLSRAHLELCMKLGLSLVVVITKYDIATRMGLRQTLAKVLSILKGAGRQPLVLTPPPHPGPDLDLQVIRPSHSDEVKAMLASFGSGVSMLVPIVITSAVTGCGIDKLHALLSHLPIPRVTESSHDLPNHYIVSDALPSAFFHVNEIFTRSDNSADVSTHGNGHTDDLTFVLSGHLRRGILSLGDTVYVGPFAPDTANEDTRLEIDRARSYPGQASTRTLSTPSRALKRLLSGSYADIGINGQSRSACHQEWQSVLVTSIRNLRLPVQKLLAGQVGTIGINFTHSNRTISSKLRKGMVLARPQDEQCHDSLGSCSGFRALFDDKKYLAMEPGQLYSTYIASIRAPAKIINVESASDILDHEVYNGIEVVDDVFDFDESGADDAGVMGKDVRNTLIEVTFQFVTYREWIEVGTQVLVMRGSGVEGSVGLEGSVGRITQTLD